MPLAPTLVGPGHWLHVRLLEDLPSTLPTLAINLTGIDLRSTNSVLKQARALFPIWVPARNVVYYLNP